MTTHPDTLLPDGYQPHTTNGPLIRTDVVDVYVFTSEPGDPRCSPRDHDRDAAWPAPSGKPSVRFLQLLRSGEPLKDTWHPVMGHIEHGETAVATALRELKEELGLVPGDPALKGMWALEQTYPFFIASINAIVMSPRFAVEVSPSYTPRLNFEHARHRWVDAADIDAKFMWPGQKACCREIMSEIVLDASISREALRVRL